MNSPYIRKQAEAFAARLLEERSSNSDRIAWAFQLAYGRSVTSPEQKHFADYIQRFERAAQTKDTPDPPTNQKLWTSITRVILTSNEFFFVD